MDRITVENLKVQYTVDDGKVYAVDDVSFTIGSNEIVGLLGESGSGKSTLSKSIVRDLPENGNITSGKIEYNEKNIAELSKREFRTLRWEDIAYVPQDAMNCLDPVYTIQDQLTETIDAHRDVGKKEKVEKAEQVFEMVGIDTDRLSDYPHEMSGGMKQRIIIALAFILNPEVIIADEPTTGLDVLLRDKILADIETYRETYDVSILIVSHDMADLVETCDSLMVMYGGKIVEKAPSRKLVEKPTHPYTMGLLNSAPTIDTEFSDLISMSMDPPDLRSPSDGCRFIEKCPYEIEECSQAHPESVAVNGSTSACYRATEHEQLQAKVLEQNWK